jgi:endonuclease YncB( thermonuclease family)
MKRAQAWRRLLPVFLIVGAMAVMPSQALPPFPAPVLRAEVSRVFDGESIRVLLTTGDVETVRYIGLDAPGPTPSECFGPEATLYNRDLTLNRTVWIEVDELERNDSGELLAYVYLDSQGLTMVNAVMLAQGLARVQDASDASPNLRYTQIFSQLQNEATNESRGLWDACPAVPLPANIAPTASFSFTPTGPEPGDEITFDASQSLDTDGVLTNFGWNFGDGNSGTGMSATHTYDSNGIFAVTLSVTDDRGSVDTTARNIAVGDTSTSEPPPPTTDPPSTPIPTGQSVIIESVQYDADGEDNDNKNGEWLVLLASNLDVDISGWTVADELGDRGVSSHVFRIPEGFTINAGSRVTIFTGCGSDNSNELYWCATTQIWDNGEDTAILRNESEDEIDRCHYGDPDGSERGKSGFNCVTFEFNQP